MQTTMFLAAALFSALSVVIADPVPQADALTTPSPAQQSKASSDVVAYLSSVTAAPDWPSYTSILAASDSDDFFGANTKDYTDITANSLFTALPADVQSYVVTVQNAQDSIISNDLFGGRSAPRSVPTTVATDQGATPTNLDGLDAYVSSVTAAPDFLSYSSIIAASDSEDLLGSNTKDYTDITANSLFTALPAGVQSYVASIHDAEISIVTKDASVATVTPRTAATSVATSKATGTAAASSRASSAAGSAASSAASSATGGAASTATSPATRTATGSAASFSGGAAPRPTGAMKAAGAAAAGLLGVVALL